jgi:hypothetical protein
LVVLCSREVLVEQEVTGQMALMVAVVVQVVTLGNQVVLAHLLMVLGTQGLILVLVAPRALLSLVTSLLHGKHMAQF